MNTASLENCKKLYELSGWDDTYWIWSYSRVGEEVSLHVRDTDLELSDYQEAYPAYDAGYLLRKLQPVTKDHGRLFVTTRDKGDWTAGFSGTYDRWHDDKGFGDIPEDAVCLLAIKLFEEGNLHV